MNSNEKINALSYAIGLLMGIVTDLMDRKLVDEKYLPKILLCHDIIESTIYKKSKISENNNK